MVEVNKERVGFCADHIAIRGPLIDGSYKLTLTVGEYEAEKVLPLPLRNGKIIKVTVD